MKERSTCSRRLSVLLAVVVIAPLGLVAAADGAQSKASVVGQWALDAAKSKAAEDGNTAGVMNKVEIRADGSFEAKYGVKGTYTFADDELVVIYQNAPGMQAKGAFDGEHLKFPAPSDNKKFCYLKRAE